MTEAKEDGETGAVVHAGKVRRWTAEQVRSTVARQRRRLPDGWELQIVADGAAVNEEDLEGLPDESDVTVMAGIPGTAPTIVHRYALIKGGKPDGAEAAATNVIAVGRVIAPFVNALERLSALLDKSFESRAKAAVETDKALRKGVKEMRRAAKARRKVQEVKEESQGQVPAMVAALAAVLGKEGVTDIAMKVITLLETKNGKNDNNSTRTPPPVPGDAQGSRGKKRGKRRGKKPVD